MGTTLELNINLEEILTAVGNDVKELQKDLVKGVQALAASTHAHVLEQAAVKLHSRHDAYRRNVSFDKISDNVWAVTVSKEALWIEDGMPAHSMVPDMLAAAGKKGKLHRAKDGSTYMMVPFEHSKAPTRQTTEAKSITEKLRGELKSRNIPYKKIERNSNGTPKLGLLHAFDAGGEKRGPTPHNVAWTSPVLDGVRVYQRLTKLKGGKESVKRDIMTFRMVSSKHFGLKWNYPGIGGVKLLDEALTWAAQEWEKVILPDILSKYK